ncbi:sensor histidine kinase [Plantibacter sp. Mn2098]|uniref:sensor histidine kinase n=1 Tax=Plantibacter sp. Mn2098 TaxID=3395266 RepID=UPI003BC1FF9A
MPQTEHHRWARPVWDAAGVDGGLPWDRPRRFGPMPPAARLWFPVIVSLLVQVPATVFAAGRGGGPFGGFDHPGRELHWMHLTAILLSILGPIALLGARRFPGPTVAVVAALSGASMLIGPAAGPPAIALAFAAASGIIRGARRWTYVSLFVGWVLVLGVALLVGRELSGLRVGITTVLLILANLLAEGARAQMERLAEYRRRQRERRTSAAQEERVRIARELHDVIAHSLAQINVQAGVGLHLMDTQPERAREALTNIKAASKSSLDEVRGLLDVLRSDGGSAGGGGGPGWTGRADATGGTAGAPDGADDPWTGGRAPRRPSPGVGELPSLVASLASQGIEATLDVRIGATPPPSSTQLALYRIAQESVTNVIRHAGAHRLDIVLVEEGDHYRLTVTDDGHGAPAGLEERGNGLLGMTERAELLGGTLEAGAGASGGFVVVASLPVAEHPSRDAGAGGGQP